MTEEKKKEITKISKAFARGFKPDIPSIKGSGWLIVDPLSAYLSALGYENTVKQIPPNGGQPLVLILIFNDGTEESKFIPAGSDLLFSNVETTDWMWT